MSWTRLLLVAGCTLFAPTPVWAQSAAPVAATSDVERAREAFVLGLALSRAEQWPDALAAFQRSAKLKAHPVTTYNIAYCERSLGRHASAYLHFTQVLALGATEQLPSAYAEEARAYVAEAEQRVAHALVSLLEPGLKLRVDDRPIVALRSADGRTAYVLGEPSDTNVPALPEALDLWLDPGPHIFAAARPGAASIVQSQSVAPGASVALELGSKPTIAPAERARPAVRRTLTRGLSQPPDRRLALTLVILGTVGLVTSATLAGIALDDKHTLDQGKCPNQVCPARYHAAEDEMKAFANAATVSLVVGALGVGVGGYLYVSAKRQPIGFEIRPRIGLGSLGAEGAFW